MATKTEDNSPHVTPLFRSLEEAGYTSCSHPRIERYFNTSCPDCGAKWDAKGGKLAPGSMGFYRRPIRVAV